MKFLSSLLLAILLANGLQAQTATYYNDKGIAVKGYDVVAYFNDHMPVEGSSKYSYQWQNVVWQFKNQSNLDAFKNNPEKYAPQFGGYCAYGVSENHKSPTDPAAFTIVNDKLYLNYNLKVKELWIKDTTERIQKGETNWKTLKDKN